MNSDYLTRWPKVFPVNNADAETTVPLFVEEIVCCHGTPRQIMAKTSDKICKFTNNKKSFTTDYHPETKGLVERFSGTLTTMLSLYVSEHQRDWYKLIPYILFSYRTANHESTKESPFYLMHILDSVLHFEDALCPPTFSYAIADDCNEEAKVRLQEDYTLVKQNLQKNQQKHEGIMTVHLKKHITPKETKSGYTLL